MAREPFGTAPDGSKVEQVQIRGGGLCAWVITWGACLRDLRLDGHPHPLVLGFDSFAPYPIHSRNFGAIVGRCANRIRNGQFRLGGVFHQLERNAGEHHIHGGSRGIGKRVWRIERQESDSVTLSLFEPDGWMGYPGACHYLATYSLIGAGTLHLRLEAEVTRATPVNLASHGYFNLDGADTIDNHVLQIDADSFLPTDDDGLPTGEVHLVAGTAFDFRTPRAVHPAGAPGYDNNYCLSRRWSRLREVAQLSSPQSGITMTVATTEPGLQLYDAGKLAVAVTGLEGRRYSARAGICLEAQDWPDAINQPTFPSPVVNPGVPYLQETSYRFEQG